MSAAPSRPGAGGGKAHDRDRGQAGPAVRGGLPLTEYGLVGDCRTAALVSREGALDWWCPERFDRPSLFAALLDPVRGGTFQVGVPGAQATLAYERGTNILVRTFVAPSGHALAWDLLPWPVAAGKASRIVRCVEATQGEVRVAVRFAPRPTYATVVPKLEATKTGIIAEGGGVVLGLGSTVPLAPSPDGGEATGEVRLRAGERAAWLLEVGAGGCADGGHEPGPGLDLDTAASLDAGAAWDMLEGTRRAWQAWDGRTTYNGPYRDAVARSALVLKLLTHEPTGAIIAAPTTSLPEEVGGTRNWDYRYAWVRDGWMLAEALHMVGHATQATAFLRWLLKAAAKTSPGLRVLYPLDPGVSLEERTLDHLSGWRDSRPVRVGNAAHDQLQLDTYGELLACLHACRLLGRDLESRAWPFLRDMVDVVAERWREPDLGIWEFRTAPRHFVHSKVLSWVALDRAVKAVRNAGLPGPADRWEREAKAVRDDVMAHGWSDKRGAFVQSYGSNALDAANLLIPLVGFLPEDDPRVVATGGRIEAELCEGPFVFRYHTERAEDGLPGEEGAFLYCSFWLVDNLALQGRIAEANARLEKLVEVAGPLGLLAEEADPRTGEMLGNYPQGFSHIGLIRSALLLAEAEGHQSAGVLARLRAWE